METALTNPTLDEVNRTLAEFCARANGPHRARRAVLIVQPDQWEEPATLIRGGGEGLRPGYLYRNDPTTTVVGCAWATSPHGNRMVRAEATRVHGMRSTGGRRRLSPFGYWCRDRAWGHANPLDVVLGADDLHRAAVEIRPAIASGEWGSPLDVFSTPVMALALIDWLEDHDYTAKRLRDYVALTAPHFAHQAGRPDMAVRRPTPQPTRNIL